MQYKITDVPKCVEDCVEVILEVSNKVNGESLLRLNTLVMLMVGEDNKVEFNAHLPKPDIYLISNVKRLTLAHVIHYKIKCSSDELCGLPEIESDSSGNVYMLSYYDGYAHLCSIVFIEKSKYTGYVHKLYENVAKSELYSKVSLIYQRTLYEKHTHENDWAYDDD